jgi:hypothetical protein
MQLLQLDGYTSDGPPTFFHSNNLSGGVFHQAVIQPGGNVCRVALSQLDWLNYDPKKYKPFDVILGSDIVYERTLIQPLCHVLR